jgi:hypothetical protein
VLWQAEIIQDPAKYVEKDPAMARTLLDQREAVSAMWPPADRRSGIGNACSIP